MNELWITFVNHEGSDQQLLVDKDEFVIGRHSSTDLCFPDERLSREHLRIEKIDDEYVATDNGSTNGTKVNGTDIFEPTVLKDGDSLVLGDRLQIAIELRELAPEIAVEEPAADAPIGAESLADAEALAPIAVAATQMPASPEPSFSPGIFLAVAVFGVLLVGILGVLIYAFASSGPAKQQDGNDFVYTKDPDDDDPPVRNTRSTPSPKPESSSSVNTPQGNSVATGTPGNNVSTKDLSETARTEQNAAIFLRKIAYGDPKAFLTSQQARTVGGKIRQISNSSSLADNINSVRKNSAQIKAIAASKSLQPQFLAAAAISKLGSSRGDVVATAREMAEVFGKLRTPIGNELYDEALLMVAAYRQGSGAEMINMLQKVVNEYPEAPRDVRTIWFLHDKGKLSDGAFDFAIMFLAVGTIAQNPKDFNVNCDALVL
jgi:hypothetical protein